MIERVKMDMNQAKYALNSRNIYKAMPSQSKHRSDTPDSGIPFLNFGTISKYSKDYYN
jgi:hypothetical protein